MRLLLHLIRTLSAVFFDALAFIHLCLRPTAAVAAENLFLSDLKAESIRKPQPPSRALGRLILSQRRLWR
jgi:hypothetical protein